MANVGIVVVSHSPQLAQAAVDLAVAMVTGEEPPIAIAAGAGDDVIGTDAIRIADAVTRVSGPAGVLVMTDLGSAILSAGLALELLDDSALVRLSSAPFVEGLMAAVVLAAGGASLDEVEREAQASLSAKQSQLGHAPQQADVVTQQPAGPIPDVVADVALINPDGLHARPAAAIAAAVSGFDATVTVANLASGAGPVSASSPTGLARLVARQSHSLRIAADGPDASAAVEAVRALIAEGFGELPNPATAGQVTTIPADASRSAPSQATPPPHALRPQAAPTRPIGVSPGRVIGRAVVVRTTVHEPDASATVPASARAVAAERAFAAATDVAVDLRELASRVAPEPRDVVLAIESVARDPELTAAIRSEIIENGHTPERATWNAISQISSAYASSGPFLAARVTDLRAVRDRIIAVLTDQPTPGIPAQSTPFVLVAADLAPTDTATLDPSLCRAIVIEAGGPTSHTAILARALGIPAVVAARNATSIADGSQLLVDGTTGEVITDPSDGQRASAGAAPRGHGAVAGPGATADGHSIPLLANIGSARDLGAAVAANVEGVGLFRTEFCFLDRLHAPSIEDQVAAYRAVFAGFPGQKIVVRTLDAGADKPLMFAPAQDEPNPALGVRGYRTTTIDPQLLDDQLAAIAAAARNNPADVWVMAPMIATVDEAADFAARCQQHQLPHVGVMIETPAAAIMADEILSVVDFVSLGTNDLTQYTLAADRTLADVAALNDPWQPSVLRLIGMVCEAGMEADKPVGVCGEAAADPALASVLTGLGVTSLSMTPRARAVVADQLRTLTLADCRAAARAACAAATATAARSAALGSTAAAGPPGTQETDQPEERHSKSTV